MINWAHYFCGSCVFFFVILGEESVSPRVRILDRFRGSRKIGPLVGFMDTRAYGNPVLQIDAIIQEPIVRPIRKAFRTSDIT